MNLSFSLSLFIPSKNRGKCNTLLKGDHLYWGAYFIDVNKWDFGLLNYQYFDFIEILYYIECCLFWNLSIPFQESLVIMYRSFRVRLFENHCQESMLKGSWMAQLVKYLPLNFGSGHDPSCEIEPRVVLCTRSEDGACLR